QEAFRRLLGDGSAYGVRISYAVQQAPDGLAQAFLIGEEHIGGEPVALVLGDNIFYGPGLGLRLRRFADVDGAAIFGYRVADPSSYGVVTFDEEGRATSLEEKPERPRSHYAVPGLYFYGFGGVVFVRSVETNARGVLVIGEMLWSCLGNGKVEVYVL